MAKKDVRVRPTVTQIEDLKGWLRQSNDELARLKAKVHQGRKVATFEGFNHRRNERKLVEVKGLFVSVLDTGVELPARLRNDVLLFLGMPKETGLLYSETEKALAE